MKKNVLLIVLIAVTGILYYPALRNQFNNWDDEAYVTANPNLELTRDNVFRSFTQGEHHRMYAPLTALSHSVVYTVFGLNPKPYIAVNIFLHLCNTLLLFLLLSYLIKNPWVPLMASALFALHPMQVESVAYVSGRRDVLYVFFYLLCLIFYVKYSIPGKHKLFNYIMSLLFAVMALLSKGQALTIPVSLFLISLYLGDAWKSRKFWTDKIPFIIIAAIIAVKVFAAPQFASGNYLSTSYLESNIPLINSLVYAAYGFIQYIVLLIFPYRLSLIHPYPELQGEYFIPYYMYIYMAGLMALVFAFFKYALKRKLWWLGLSFFAVNIVMLLQIIPNSYGIMNDHYVYFAGIGIFLIIADFVYGLMKSRKLIFLISLVFSIYLVVQFTLSYQRIGVFKNSVKLWSDVIEKYPDSYMAYNSRANTYFYQGFIENAISDYKKAIEIFPANYKLYVNLGSAFLAVQQYKNAAEVLTVAINGQPSSEAYLLRAMANVNLNLKNVAMSDYNNAIRLKPDNSGAYNKRGALFEQMADTTKALNDYAKAIELDSTNTDAYLNCARLYSATGNVAEALNFLNRVISVQPDFAIAYNSRGIILANQGLIEAALKDFSAAIKYKSDYAEAYNNRGSVYYRQGSMDLAIDDYSRAAEINPQFAETFNNRGAAYISLGETEKACSDFTIAAQLGLQNARENFSRFCK